MGKTTKKTELTIQEFAKQSGLSRQAVHDAVNAGKIPARKTAKTTYIDPESPAVKVYLMDSVKNSVESKSRNYTNRPGAVGLRAPFTEGKRKDQQPPSDDGTITGETPYEIKMRTLMAEMRKKEAQAKILEKNYLPREFIEDGLFRYLERLNTTIERSASAFVTEVGQKILEAGEVNPSHIEAFVSLVLEAIDGTKKRIIKEIEKYDPAV
jgi:hypothetical protein